MTEATKTRIELNKIPMAELWKVKGAIGRSVMVEFNNRGAEAFDEQMCAALVWVVRSRNEPELTFDAVFQSLDFAQLQEFEVVFDESPPESAASSEIAPKSSRRSRGSTGQAHQGFSTP